MESTPATSVHLTASQGAVTCMRITPSFIIVGLDNGELHILNHDGGNGRVVKAMERGVWCVDAWEDEWVIAGGAEGALGAWNLSDL